MSISKLKSIGICDFKCFSGSHTTSINIDAKNIMIYGENGSGKSSIFDALDNLFKLDGPQFNDDLSRPTCLRNRFSMGDSSGHITLTFSDSYSDLVWNINDLRPDEVHYYRIRQLSRFINYKDIMRIHINNTQNEYIDIFYSFVNFISSYIETSPGSNHRIIDEWKEIIDQFKNLSDGSVVEIISDNPELTNRLRFNEEAWIDTDNSLSERDQKVNASREFIVNYKSDLIDKLESFSSTLQNLCDIINSRSNQILALFENGVEVILSVNFNRANIQSFTSINHIQVHLKAIYKGVRIENPSSFLNESRLTAISLSLFFAGILETTPPGRTDSISDVPRNDVPRLLILDDPLIGLDMSHRINFLDALELLFPFENWQIALFTYDRPWYQIAKQRLNASKWIFNEIHMYRDDANETPILIIDNSHIERAQGFLRQGELKAAAVHVRTDFEMYMRALCERFRIKMVFTTQIQKIETSSFISALFGHKWSSLSREIKVSNDNTNGRITSFKYETEKIDIIPDDMKRDIETAFSWVLNPGVHSQISDLYLVDIEKSIRVLESLKSHIDDVLQNKSGKINQIIESNNIQILNNIRGQINDDIDNFINNRRDKVVVPPDKTGGEDHSVYSNTQSRIRTLVEEMKSMRSSDSSVDIRSQLAEIDTLIATLYGPTSS